MILTANHDLWFYELGLINELIKLEDRLAVITPLVLEKPHTTRYSALCKVGAFFAGFMPVVAMLVIGGLL